MQDCSEPVLLYASQQDTMNFSLLLQLPDDILLLLLRYLPLQDLIRCSSGSRCLINSS